MRLVVLRRFLRLAGSSVLLAAPLVGAAQLSERLVAPAAQAAVERLVRVTAPLRAGPGPSEPMETEPTRLNVGLAVKGAPPRTTHSVSGSKPPPLFVSRAAVLGLARSSARPRGVFVARTQLHPAGLQLSGVAALGIGLQDGDVLVEALGIAPRSPGELIAAIIEARAQRVGALGGTVWRQGQTFRITVEQPYLPPA